MYFISILYHFIQYQNNEYHKILKLKKKESVKKLKYTNPEKFKIFNLDHDLPISLLVQ